MCRGGLACPPATRCVCTINTFGAVEKVFHRIVEADLYIRPNALCLYGQSILSISFTVTMIWWRRAVFPFCNAWLTNMPSFCTMSRRLILIYVLFLTTTIFRFCTKLRHLCYCNKWRVYSAIIGGSPGARTQL